MSNNAIGKSWSDVRNQLFTPDEIAESDLRVALIGELIKARQEKGISQGWTPFSYFSFAAMVYKIPPLLITLLCKARLCPKLFLISL